MYPGGGGWKQEALAVMGYPRFTDGHFGLEFVHTLKVMGITFFSPCWACILLDNVQIK
jgi:hypothetical protein